MPSSGTTSPTAGIAPSSATADAVRLDGIHFHYGRESVLHHVSLALPRGCFFTLLGPSGCGKTTLLQLIGGYLKPTAGTIWLNGKDVTNTLPEARNAGMVFQNYALFPHLTAADNVAFGLRVRGVSKSDRTRRVSEMFDLVGLELAERSRKPDALSGGQQQRVALARALAFRPDLLLLDEPLANLDRQLRDRMRLELRRIHSAAGSTTLLLTHDQEEALAMSDIIGVMNWGTLLQVGSPREVYDHPRTPFVATFLGDANLIEGPLVGRAENELVMVRPESVQVSTEPMPLRWNWPGRVVRKTFQGADEVLVVACEGFILNVRVRSGQPGSGRIFVGFEDPELWTIPERDPVKPPLA